MSTSILEKMLSLDLQSHFFRDKRMWSLETETVLGMNLLLGDHANIHFSPARSLFLYQLRSLDALSYFSPVQIKDGLATMIGFFYEHQAPSSSEQVFLVPKRLEKFVPVAWRDQVFSYEHKTFRQTETKRDKLIFVVSALDEKQISLSGLDKLISKLADNHTFSEVNVVVMPQKSLYSQEEILVYQMQIVLRLQKTWPNIKIKLLNDFNSSTLTDSYFIDLNEYAFYYGHSTLVDFFLQRGAKDFTNSDNAQQEAVLKIPLSFYHEMHLTSIDNKNELGIENYFSSIQKSSIINQEIKNYRPQKIDSKNLIVSPSIYDLAWDLSQKTKSIF